MSDCLKCNHKLYCMVTGYYCYSKSLELTWTASAKYRMSEYKNPDSLLNEYKSIDSRRNGLISYSPTK